MNPTSSSGTLKPRKLLVRGVNWLGDAVMTTPALLRLKEALPETEIILLTPDKLLQLWHGHPAVDQIIGFRAGQGVWSVARELRPYQCDVALILPNSPRSALEPWLAGIPHRVGYGRSWRKWLLTRPVEARPGAVHMRKRSESEIRSLIAASPGPGPSLQLAPSAHQSHDYLHLAARLGANSDPVAPCIAVSERELNTAHEKIRSLFQPVPSKAHGSGFPVLGLNPGAEYGPAKRWPAENFVEVARAICGRHPQCAWIVLGGPGDAEVCAGIAARIGPAAVNLAGKTTLQELKALLKVCHVVLTNDTGPMHLAAAVGTSVVVPFGSTCAGLTGPGLPGDRRHKLLHASAPCSPCFLRSCPIDFRCMHGISVPTVVQAVEELLKEQGKALAALL